MNASISIIKADLGHTLTISELVKKTFLETYNKTLSLSNIEEYLKKKGDLNTISKEIQSDDICYYIALFEGKTAGYLKLIKHKNKKEFNESVSLEIEKIYVLNAFQQNKIGYLLMLEAEKIAKVKKIENIWLAVWEKNNKAILFYQKMNYTKIGNIPFYLGNEILNDFMLAKKIMDNNQSKSN